MKRTRDGGDVAVPPERETTAGPLPVRRSSTRRRRLLTFALDELVENARLADAGASNHEKLEQVV